MLWYYTGYVLNGSANDKTRLWKIALTKYVSLAGLMLVINAKDEAHASYYTHNPRFDHVSSSVLFFRLVKILDALKYFCLYTFSQRTGTGPV